MHKVQTLIALLVTSVLVLAACGPGKTTTPNPAPPTSPSTAPQAAPTPQSSGWDTVLAAARKEGTVMVYNVLGSNLSDALKEGGKQLGIKVETVGGTGGELELKIMTEQRAKAYYGDLFMGGWSNQVNVVDAGFGQQVTVDLPSLAQKDVWKIDPAKYVSKQNVYVSGTGLTPAAIVNTELVGKSDIQSWQDLLDPKWRDKMVMTDGRTGSGPGNAGLMVWMTILGEDFWKKMASQRITLQASYDIPVSQVSLGDKAVGLFPAYSRVVAAIKAGAPIRIVHFKEGTPYYLNGTTYLKNAPHPNAAMMLLNWMFTREGQVAIGRSLGNYTIRKDVTEDWLGIPELNLKTFTLLEPPTSFLSDDDRLKAVDFAKKVFGAR